jgi:hypothetical protein
MSKMVEDIFLTRQLVKKFDKKHIDNWVKSSKLCNNQESNYQRYSVLTPRRS